MVTVRQSRKTLSLDEPLTGLRISYDGEPRIDASAHKEALEDAYRKGYDEASQQFNQQINDFRSDVNALRERTFSALEGKFGVIMEEAREALMTLTHECVRRTLGGIELDGQIVLSIVNSAIEDSGLDDEKMEIRLNPMDADLLADLESDLKKAHPRLSVVPDEGLNRGDCMLSSRFGKVDGLLATKLDRLKDGLTAD